MSQHFKIKELVEQMHEKNIVLVNILRDIAENEVRCDLAFVGDDDDFSRTQKDCSIRRREILAEIVHFLQSENLVQQVHA